MSERASIFDSSEEIDVSGFEPKKINPKAPVPAEVVRSVAEEANFVSREPVKSRKARAQKKEQRRHRTGRNVQVNIKASQATVDRFNAIVEAQDWVTGYVLERGVAALERELASRGASARSTGVDRGGQG